MLFELSEVILFVLSFYFTVLHSISLVSWLVADLASYYFHCHDWTLQNVVTVTFTSLYCNSSAGWTHACRIVHLNNVHLLQSECLPPEWTTFTSILLVLHFI